MKRLEGKAVIVTGAANGIGAATLRLFAAQGAKVVAIDTDDVTLENNVRNLPGESLAIPTDVTNPESVTKMVSEAQLKCGKIDGLVHYAGITRDALHWKMNLESFEEVIKVNLVGTFIVAKAVSEVMRTQGGGSMVLTASRVYLGNIGQANYAASKGAVVSLARTLALELAQFDIRVNVLAPGFIDTRMTRQLPEKIREKAVAAIPLRRIGQPEDVAHAAMFLISDEASFMTGQVLFIDGGRTVGFSSA